MNPIKFNQLNNMIENSLAKPINDKIEINMNEKQNKVKRQMIMNVFEQLEKLSKYKDKIICRILIDKNKKFLMMKKIRIIMIKIIIK